MTGDVLIPILVEHDQKRVVGKVYSKEGKLFVEFHGAVLLNTAFDILGNAGLHLLEIGGGEDTLVSKAEIFEFSTPPPTTWSPAKQSAARAVIEAARYGSDRTYSVGEAKEYGRRIAAALAAWDQLK